MSTHLDRRPTGDDDLENALRGAFRHGADLMPATTDPWSRTTRAVHRSQVRRRTGAVAAIAAAAVVGVVGLTTPWADGLRRAEPLPADRGGPVVTDLRAWPTRGDLAGDDTLLATARKALTDQGSRVVSVPFAGRVGEERMVLAVAVDGVDDTGPTAVPVAVALYPDREARGGSVGGGINYERLVDGRLTYATRAPDGGVDAVVLVAAGTAVAVSPKAGYDEQGRPARTYRRVPTRDGVAVLHLGGTTEAQVSFRISRAGRTTFSDPDVWDLRGTGEVVGDGRVDEFAADPACGGRMTGEDLQGQLQDLYRLRGLAPAVPVEVRGCRDTERGRAGVLVVRTADRKAAFVLAFEFVDEPDGGFVTPARLPGQPVPPARAAVWPVPVTAPSDSYLTSDRMLVDAPGAATVEVAAAGGGPVLAAGRVAPDGFAVARSTAGPIPDLVRLTTKDARGKVLVSYDVDRTTARDDLATTVDGPVS